MTRPRYLIQRQRRRRSQQPSQGINENRGVGRGRKSRGIDENYNGGIGGGYTTRQRDQRRRRRRRQLDDGPDGSTTMTEASAEEDEPEELKTMAEASAEDKEDTTRLMDQRQRRQQRRRRCTDGGRWCDDGPMAEASVKEDGPEELTTTMDVSVEEETPWPGEGEKNVFMSYLTRNFTSCRKPG